MIRGTLDGNQTKSISRNSRQVDEKVCGNDGNQEDYVRYDQTFIHNTSTPFNVSFTTTGSSKWGIKEVIFLAKLCHWACLSCFGALVSQCTACTQDTPVPMLLSGTTCN